MVGTKRDVARTRPDCGDNRLGLEALMQVHGCAAQRRAVEDGQPANVMQRKRC